jgi:trypsin/pre-peptidase
MGDLPTIFYAREDAPTDQRRSVKTMTALRWLARRHAVALFCVLLAWSLPGGALAAAPAPLASPSARLRERIANGLPTQQFQSVGWLLIDQFSNTNFCTGTLIGCHTFITAAHCICVSGGLVLTGAQCLQRADLLDPSGKRIYLQNGGVFQPASITVHPDFQFGVGADIALLTLAQPVTGVAPSALNATGKVPSGTSGTIVGFGLAGFAGGLGIKEHGKVVTSPCTIVPADPYVCWEFADPLGPPGEDSDTCPGDSGGPLFADLGSGPVLAGITAGGSTECTPPDDSFDTEVFTYRSWIVSQAGSDLGTQSCGGLPAAGGPGSTIAAGGGTLSAAMPSQLFTVDVPPSTDTLRVTLNTDTGLDGDLYVKLGGPATPGDFDCRSINAGFFPESCEILSPSPGTWSILVNRSAGSGNFQMTATYYSPNLAPGAQFYTVPPCRLVDTRNPDGPLGGPVLAPNSVRNFLLTGVCGVPSDAKALSVNVSVTQPTAPGFLRLYPGDFPAPLSSAINFSTGQTRSNNALVALPADPGAGVNVSADSAGTVHFILDVNGYFR